MSRRILVKKPLDHLTATNSLTNDIFNVLDLNLVVKDPCRKDLHQRPHLTKSLTAAPGDISRIPGIGCLRQPGIRLDDLQPRLRDLCDKSLVNIHRPVCHTPGPGTDHDLAQSLPAFESNRGGILKLTHPPPPFSGSPQPGPLPFLVSPGRRPGR